MPLAARAICRLMRERMRIASVTPIPYSTSWTEATMWTHGNFYWNELMTRDVEKAKKFYGETIGWSFEAMPMPNGTYWVAKLDGKPVGGIFPLNAPEFKGMPEQWMSYL